MVTADCMVKSLILLGLRNARPSLNSLRLHAQRHGDLPSPRVVTLLRMNVFSRTVLNRDLRLLDDQDGHLGQISLGRRILKQLFDLLGR